MAAALDQSGASRETVARSLGVSRQIVDGKVAGTRPLTVGDVLDLIESGGAGLRCAECVVAEMQARVDARRSKAPPASDLLARIGLLVGGIVGELQAAVACVGAAMSADAADAADEILRLCAAARAQIGTLEACVRGAMR